MKKRIFIALIAVIITCVSLIVLSSCEDPCAEGHVPGDWTLHSTPTCSNEGKEIITCTNCHRWLEEKVIPKTEHTIGNWVTVFESTCSEQGKKQISCTVCSEVLETKVLPLEPHVGGEWEVTLQETCTEAGQRVQNCTVCEAQILQETIEPHHTPEVIPAVEATCAKEGSTEGSKCANCDTVFTEPQAIAKKEHVWVKDSYKAPTCAAYGYTEGSHCSSCKVWNVEPEKIDKLPHTPVDDPAVEPTHASTGLTAGSHCKVCKEPIVKQKTIPAIGHDFDILTNSCSCSAKEYPEINSYQEWEDSDSSDSNGFVFNFYNIGLDSSVMYTMTIPADTNYIRLVGKADQVFKNVKIVVSERTADLTIDLVNFRMEIPHANNVPITVKGEANVTIGMYGTTCSITAPKGYANTITAFDAEDGMVAISAPECTVNLVVATSEESYIKGGDGGNGCNGMNPIVGGYGGDGGDGAMAIVADKITVSAKSGYSSSSLKITGGAGGQGGNGTGIGGEDGSDGKAAEKATNVPVTYK